MPAKRVEQAEEPRYIRTAPFEPLLNPSAVFFPQLRRVIVFGGFSPTTSSLRNEVFDLPPDARVGPPPPVPVSRDQPVPPERSHHMAAALTPSHMVVFGGLGAAGVLSDVWIWDVDRRVWSPVEIVGPPLARLDACCVVHHGALFVFGGFDGSARCSSVHMLTVAFPASGVSGPVRCRWRSVSTSGSPPEARDGACCAYYSGSGGHMVLFGGFGASHTVASAHLLELPSPPMTEASSPPADARVVTPSAGRRRLSVNPLPVWPWEVTEPVTGATWLPAVSLPNAPSPRESAVCGIVLGRFVVAGGVSGSDGGNLLDDVHGVTISSLLQGWKAVAGATPTAVQRSPTPPADRSKLAASAALGTSMSASTASAKEQLGRSAAGSPTPGSAHAKDIRTGERADRLAKSIAVSLPAAVDASGAFWSPVVLTTSPAPFEPFAGVKNSGFVCIDERRIVVIGGSTSAGPLNAIMEFEFGSADPKRKPRPS